jgi:hypothetical protein
MWIVHVLRRILRLLGSRLKSNGRAGCALVNLSNSESYDREVKDMGASSSVPQALPPQAVVMQMAMAFTGLFPPAH